VLFVADSLLLIEHADQQQLQLNGKPHIKIASQAACVLIVSNVCTGLRVNTCSTWLLGAIH
jgi:hypothetical protein